MTQAEEARHPTWTWTPLAPPDRRFFCCLVLPRLPSRKTDKPSQSTAAATAIVIIDYVQMVLYIGLMGTMVYMMFFMKKGH